MKANDNVCILTTTVEFLSVCVKCFDLVSVWCVCVLKSFLFSFHQGSRDNMSVILICFPNAPKVSLEAVKREAELDKYLESRVEGGSFKKK